MGARPQADERAMKPLGEMTAAEYRAHERDFGLELARNLRTARERPRSPMPA
jgi:hypothetical protein